MIVGDHGAIRRAAGAIPGGEGTTFHDHTLRIARRCASDVAEMEPLTLFAQSVQAVHLYMVETQLVLSKA